MNPTLTTLAISRKIQHDNQERQARRGRIMYLDVNQIYKAMEEIERKKLQLAFEAGRATYPDQTGWVKHFDGDLTPHHPYRYKTFDDYITELKIP